MCADVSLFTRVLPRHYNKMLLSFSLLLFSSFQGNKNTKWWQMRKQRIQTQQKNRAIDLQRRLSLESHFPDSHCPFSLFFFLGFGVGVVNFFFFFLLTERESKGQRRINDKKKSIKKKKRPSIRPFFSTPVMVTSLVLW